MAIQRQNLTRVFMYSGVRLNDPDASMSPIAVRDLYAAAGKPELSSAEVRGPEVVGNELVFTLHRAVGTKGADEKALRKAMATIRNHKVVLAHNTVRAAVIAVCNPSGRPLPVPSQTVPWML